MTPTRIKWMLFIFPAIIIGGFETLRHTLLENVLPTELGNWITATIDAGVIASLSRKLFGQFELAQTDLLKEREARAVLEDRERLAQALHDEIAQTIFYAGVQLTSIERHIQSNDQVMLVERIKDLHILLRDLDDSTRQAIHNLKQDIHTPFHLSQQLSRFLHSTFAVSNIRFVTEIDERTSGMLSLEQQMHLFMIVREAVTNVLKHSRATDVQVSLGSVETGTWKLEIRDNGQGFNISTVRRKCFGVETMQMRARVLDAKFVITSSSMGTVVTVSKDLESDAR